MLTIVLAAGNGQRFVDAGYSMPKPLLVMPNGGALLDWVRERLPQGRKLIVARREDRAHLTPHIHGMGHVWIDDLTGGPLESARAASVYIAMGDELLITYCDAFLSDGAQAFVDAARAAQAATAMVVFRSTDPRYGYWNGAQVIEKQAISPWAVSGLFYFRQGAIFIERSQLRYSAGAGLPALMDAQTYCYQSDVVDVGTPSDYEDFCGTYHGHLANV